MAEDTSTGPGNFTTLFSSKLFAGDILGDGNCKGVVFDGPYPGSPSHFALYVPGSGACYVFIWSAKEDTLVPLYQSTNQGIGGFDLMFEKDRIRPYDYDHTGRIDHLLCYRPGSGCVMILKHDGQGNFSAVYAMPTGEYPSISAGSGIGGYQFRWPWDRAFTFDFDHSGKLDHICVYQRHNTMNYSLGHRQYKNTWTDPQNSDLLGRCAKFVIIKHGENDRFYSVYRNIYGGIGGYDMGQGNGGEGDYAFAYDYEGSGCQDYILFIYPYKPTIVRLIKHQGDKFVTTHNTKSGYSSRVKEPAYTWWFAYDFESSGKMDHFGLWEPGSGSAWIMGKPLGAETPVVLSGSGLGICDLTSGNDRLFAFDFDASGCKDYILAIRFGGKRGIWLFRQKGHVPKPPLQQQQQAPQAWQQQQNVPQAWSWSAPAQEVPPGIW